MSDGGRKANAREIHRILREMPQDVLAKIRDVTRTNDVQVSMPLDGNGARLLVAARIGAKHIGAANLSISLDGESLLVPIEITANFQEMRSLEEVA